MADRPSAAPPAAPARASTLDVNWPGRPLTVMPGDFSKYVPQGMGLDVQPVIRPWDDPVEAVTTPSYYGFETRETDPVRGTPTQEASGGVIYFDDGISRRHILTALFVMGVNLHEREFVVFQGPAGDTVGERYLDQARIMRKGALQYLFRPGPEAADLPVQPVTMGDFIRQFIDDQRKKWNDPRYTFSDRLSGTFGGDGDWAKELLCFGFMVENSYWGVYRLWSRAWLVTK